MTQMMHKYDFIEPVWKDYDCIPTNKREQQPTSAFNETL